MIWTQRDNEPIDREQLPDEIYSFCPACWGMLKVPLEHEPGDAQCIVHQLKDDPRPRKACSLCERYLELRVGHRSGGPRCPTSRIVPAATVEFFKADWNMPVRFARLAASNFKLFSRLVDRHGDGLKYRLGRSANPPNRDQHGRVLGMSQFYAGSTATLLERPLIATLKTRHPRVWIDQLATSRGGKAPKQRLYLVGV